MIAAFEPQGLALAAYLAGRHAATVTVHCADGESEDVEAAHFFRDEAAFESWERAALDAARGRVLDVGAGAGCHSLALAARGRPVTALDVSSHAVDVMRARGVADARVGDLGSVHDGPFDTLLLLMHGAGLGGDVPGLQWMLADARRLLAPDGRILLDSRAPEAPDGRPLASHSDAGYPGVAELSMEFEGRLGAPFLWLFVDEARLARVAARVGLASDVIHRDDDGRYVALLTAKVPT